MKLKQLFPSNYLAQPDLPNPVTVIIQAVVIEELHGDNGKEEKPILHFHPSNGLKPMVLNKENGQSIANLYGDDTDSWIGKSIELWVNPNVTMMGRVTGGIRVRKPNPAASGAAPGGRIIYTFAQAVAECEKVGITKAELIAGLKSKGLAGYQTGRDTPYVLECIEFARNRAAQQPEESFDDDPSTGPPEPPANDEIPF